MEPVLGTMSLSPMYHKPLISFSPLNPLAVSLSFWQYESVLYPAQISFSKLISVEIVNTAVTGLALNQVWCLSLN
jgi:hypothetical protein